MKKLFLGLFISCLLGQANAASFSEVDDAGELINNAQVTTGNGPLTSITGSLIDLGQGKDDIDLFEIFISDTSVFSVTVTSNFFEDDGSDGDNDSTLFLFDYSGVLAAFAEDIDNANGNYLPQFNTGDVDFLSNGTYFLGFALYNTYPTYPYDVPLSGWDRDPWTFQTGAYTLTLTGTQFSVPAQTSSVPEPTSITLLGIGLAGVGFSRKRKLPN
jgi:PEP-CTERM motif-containing protein